MVATSIFLPWEVYELAWKNPTWLKVAAFVINLLLVIYLVCAKRLFGIRGGKAAYEARLRTESVIEVEQAALAAASPAEPGQAQPHLRGAAQSGSPRPDTRSDHPRRPGDHPRTGDSRVTGSLNRQQGTRPDGSGRLTAW